MENDRTEPNLLSPLFLVCALFVVIVLYGTV
jgi:hypothetical protein